MRSEHEVKQSIYRAMIMLSWAAGADVQSKCLVDLRGGEWQDTEDPFWDWSNYEYRLKKA